MMIIIAMAHLRTHVKTEKIKAGLLMAYMLRVVCVEHSTRLLLK